MPLEPAKPFALELTYHRWVGLERIFVGVARGDGVDEDFVPAFFFNWFDARI